MKARYTPLLIVSVERSDRSKEENLKMIDRFELYLKVKGIKYQKGVGVFKGDIEASYIFQDTLENKKVVKSAVLQYDQDSYLEVSSEGRGYLIDKLGDQVSLGALIVQTEMPSVDYTYLNDKYLTFKGA